MISILIILILRTWEFNLILSFKLNDQIKLRKGDLIIINELVSYFMAPYLEF